MHQEVAAALFLQDGTASRKRGEKILLDIPDHRAVEQERSALEVEIQTAEIQIGGAHSGDPVITHKGFGMHKALFIFIDTDPARTKSR